MSSHFAQEAVSLSFTYILTVSYAFHCHSNYCIMYLEFSTLDLELYMSMESEKFNKINLWICDCISE